MSAFPSSLFAGRRYAVLGLGRNGNAAAQALAAMGATVQAWDDGETGRAGLSASPGVTLAPFETLDGFDALVMSPGIPHRLPAPHPVAALAQRAGVPILSDAELLFAAVRAAGSRARFAGITGTNGKSTTTTLLAHLLAQAGRPVAAGGNLGTASLALPLLPDDGVYVLEMSSYMLERLRTLRFDVACLLNLTPDHLDRHGDMAGYGAAKRAIFDRQTAQDVAVVAVDDAFGRETLALLGRGTRVSGSGADADVTVMNGLLRDRHGVLADLADADALPGAHNAQNAATAAAMALALGVPRDLIAPGLASFAGLPHRQRLVGRIGGVAFVDDSKATNADAAARALGCYDRLVWIAGGLAKAGGIESLAPFFPRVTETLLIGQDAPALACSLAARGARHRIVETMARAVPEALAAARRDDAPVVLLSPACASFDQYPNFEARGLDFAARVQALAAAPVGENA